MKGEIDIVEGVNNISPSSVFFHTASGELPLSWGSDGGRLTNDLCRWYQVVQCLLNDNKKGDSFFACPTLENSLNEFRQDCYFEQLWHVFDQQPGMRRSIPDS